MAGSYEKRVHRKEESPEKIEHSILKYFWLVNPLNSVGKKNVPRFLRQIKVLKNFSDNELRILTSFMHHRTFADKEVIIRQNEIGIGFYFLYKGFVDIYVKKNDYSDGADQEENHLRLLTLEEGDYFGELSLLQENSIRNASAISKEGCQLIGIFKPDVDELINSHPVVAAKLLQSVSQIIANRLFSITKEVKELKLKIATYKDSDE